VSATVKATKPWVVDVRLGHLAADPRFVLGEELLRIWAELAQSGGAVSRLRNYQPLEFEVGEGAVAVPVNV
jgi:hypothetical protein